MQISGNDETGKVLGARIYPHGASEANALALTPVASWKLAAGKEHFCGDWNAVVVKSEQLWQ